MRSDGGTGGKPSGKAAADTGAKFGAAMCVESVGAVELQRQTRGDAGARAAGCIDERLRRHSKIHNLQTWVLIEALYGIAHEVNDGPYKEQFRVTRG